MSTSTITSKHQTTVPREVREQLHIKPGAILRWEVRGKEILVTPEEPAFFALKGSIKVGKGSTVQDVREARRRRGLAE